MELLACGHAANVGRLRICLHLAVAEIDEDVARLYTGRGGEYHLLCEPCLRLDEPESQLATVCEGCVERADEEYVASIGGAPEIRHRDRPIGGSFHEEVVLRFPDTDRCLAPLGDGWLLYTGRQLMAIGGTASFRYKLKGPRHPDGNGSRKPGSALSLSPDGRFAAVVVDYGRYGVVVDLAAGGRVTMKLDRQDYHTAQTPFPFAFLADGTLVAATDWNRLDRFETATGKLLTPRDTSWKKDTPRPEHHLDYFHGRLTVNPAGTWLADDGWIWAPYGLPTAIDLTAWSGGDTYAAEHGEVLTSRFWQWDQPIAWVTDTTVAIQKIGDNDEAMVDGVQLFDVPSGRRIDTVHGPDGRMWAVDGRLAVCGRDGLEIWDLTERARIGVLPGFHPTSFNARTRTFAVLDDFVLRTYRLPG